MPRVRNAFADKAQTPAVLQDLRASARESGVATSMAVSAPIAVVAGVVFFAVRAPLALIPGLTVGFPIRKCRVELIIREFGKPVADIVMEVTDDKNLPKEERKHRQSKPR